jgi:hypothetical protein
LTTIVSPSTTRTTVASDAQVVDDDSWASAVEADEAVVAEADGLWLADRAWPEEEAVLPPEQAVTRSSERRDVAAARRGRTLREVCDKRVSPLR